MNRDIFTIFVKYLIPLKYTPDLPEKVMMNFPTDSCNNSVDFFIRDYFITGEKIYEFSMNNNDRAVEYLISNCNNIDYTFFSTNINNKAVEHMISDSTKINLEKFILNNINYKAIKYIFSRINYFFQHFTCGIFTDTSKINCIISLIVTENKQLIIENTNLVYPLINKLLSRYKNSLYKKSYKIRDTEENNIFKYGYNKFSISYLMYLKSIFLDLKTEKYTFRKYHIDKDNLKKIQELLYSNDNFFPISK